jgi:hypothetical protein
VALAGAQPGAQHAERSVLPSFSAPATTAAGRALRVLGALAVLALLLLLRAPVCPMAAITHHPCPGCGLTRATVALLRGHLGEAVRLHPLAPLVSPLIGGFLAYAAARYVREGRWPATEGKAAGRMAAAGLLLWVMLMVVWLARFQGAFGGPVAV